jgi:hexosaminidase
VPASAAPSGGVSPGAPPLRLLFRTDPARADLADEGYELRLEPQGATAVSKTEAGLVFAAQTLRQLVFGHGSQVPCCRILDKPRFSWRGVHLDSARHFFPVETVLRLIDLASLHKLNRLHWHLTDDQGWRLEIRSRPLLTTVGAAENQYYTREDVKRVLAHA